MECGTNYVRSQKKRILIFSAVILIILAIIIIVSPLFKKTPETYTIQFDSNGGTDVLEQVVEEGDSAVLPPEPTKDGHYFVGWAEDDEAYDFTDKVEENTTLTAIWKEAEPEKEYITIRFDSKGGTTILNSIIEKGKKVEKPKAPQREGYIFLYWTNSGKKFNFETLLYEDLELVAQWEKVIINSTNKDTTPNKDTTTSVTNPNNKRNVIHFISTGASDAILIESNGKYGLVDSSNPYNDGTLQAVSNEKESVKHVVDYLNNMKIQYLDFIIGTHSHSDHIGGMPEIASRFVNNKTTYYYRTYDGASNNQPNWDNEGYYNRAIASMKTKNAKLVDVTNKKPTYKYGELDIVLINTDKSEETEENNNSIGVIVKCGATKVFLSGDIEVVDSNKISSEIGEVDVLKINHHGYSGTSPEYISKLKPNHIVITNNYVPQNAIATLAYAQAHYNTIAYYTGSVSESIKVHLHSNSYQLENSGPSINLNTTAWLKWDGKYMYLQNGKVYKTWLSWENKWYYLDDEGFMVTSWKYLKWSKGVDWFYFEKSGEMLTGWQELTWSGGKNWFYFHNVHGYMLTGWQYLKWSGGENWFYFEPTHGYLYQNTCATISNKKYCFDSNGACYNGC